ncbi:hypothetical protein [Nocardioides sp. B-3]|uniref:spermine/spermidine synthase domain-containing protein n=1 Tax=Nocardioides sp. B-3 TaxID=2895565 RepID=UPI00215286A7|nr:hypothetical protein [Nocardioides sp. B-3]UUZ60269.1 hypothetical protein LP418_04880 [Nocardioides sp. B-3]
MNGEEIVEVARAESERGEVVLRRRTSEVGADVLELRVNGVFVMDTIETASEIELAAAALDLVPDPRDVVVGGLGLGFTAQRVLADPRVERVMVVEIEESLVEWMRNGTIPHGPALLADQRIKIVNADLLMAIAEARSTYDLILLDVDNGPGYLVHEDNARLRAGVPAALRRPAQPQRRAGDLVRGGGTRAARRHARRLRHGRGTAQRRAAPGPAGDLLPVRRAARR